MKILVDAKANTDIQDREGNIVLILSAWRDYTEVVKMLMDAKANTDIQNKHGETALICAELNGYLEIVKMLKERQHG